MNPLHRAAELIADADALVVSAGAGMGVDSGLPDFRGKEWFWEAYPPFRARNLSFTDLANPVWFARDPAQAWGFYGHRRQLYRDTTPHAGFRILLKWAHSKPRGYFVFTSNVDGHFQRSGFDSNRIVECHGSIHHLQCSRPCCSEIWLDVDSGLEIDSTTFRAKQPLPKCKSCSEVARPNILMFGDWNWLQQRTAAQEQRFRKWISGLQRPRLAVIECGAGTAVPTVRSFSEHLPAELIRINTREPDVPHGGVSLATGALEALKQIDAAL